MGKYIKNHGKTKLLLVTREIRVTESAGVYRSYRENINLCSFFFRATGLPTAYISLPVFMEHR